MIFKKVEYDKNFYDGDEMCIGCGTEFDALEELFILGSGDNFICMECIKKLYEHLKKECFTEFPKEKECFTNLLQEHSCKCTAPKRRYNIFGRIIWLCSECVKEYERG